MTVHILKTALPVFIALFLGVLCRRFAILTNDGAATLRRVAVDICLPAVLFGAFATADYSSGKLLIPLFVFALCVLALLIGKLIGRLLHQESRLAPFLMTGFEAGMLGYGLFALLYPGESSAEFAIIDLGQVLFVFTLYKGLLKGKGKAGELVSEAFSSPVIWAILIGMVFGVTGLYTALEPSGVTGVIAAVTDFVAAPTSCLILITIGFDLRLKDTPWGRALGYTAERFAVMGVIYALALLIDRHLLGGSINSGALLLMLILPAPYVLPVFSDAEEERTAIASTLSVMTLASLLLFCVLAAAV